MKKMGWFLLLILLAVGAYALFRRDPPQSASTSPLQAKQTVAAEGKVETMAGYDLNLGTGELNGKVEKILVREGDNVAQGQLVAVLENDDLRAQVKAAEGELAVAQSRLLEVKSGARREEIRQAAAALDGAAAALDEARRQHGRYNELLAKGMVAPAAVDERERVMKVAEAKLREIEQQKKLLEAGPKAETLRLYRDQVALALAGLERSRKLLEKTAIRSPIAGRVIKRYLDEGEGVTPEIPILAIADLSKIWINAEVDETDIGLIHVGDAAAITSDAYRGTVYKGRVKQIADYAGLRNVKPSNPAVNLGLKVVQVKIELLDASPFRLGMSVDVKITPGKR
ncbi:MAG: HlyD family secretion protein [Burkholderiales bacterium]